MNIVPDFPPPTHEVKDQLNRMLASPRFTKALKISAFLELVVLRKLAGRSTSSRTVGRTLYKEKYNPKFSDDVRVAANTLRGKLDDYYALEGKNDIIIISLPKPLEDRSIRAIEGAAYAPSFSYSKNHWITMGVRIGYLWLHRWSYYNIVHALEHFRELLKEHPKSLGPTIGLVETLCHFDDRGYDTPDRVDIYTTSYELLQQLVDPPERYWKLWAVRARVELSQKNLAGAAVAFEKAIKLDRAKAESYLPYLYFLAQVDRREEALVLGYNYIDQHMEDSFAFAQLALLFGVLSEGEASKKAFQVALQIDPGNCCAHELAVVVNFALRDFEGVVRHLKVLYGIYDTESFQAVLAFCIDQDQRLGLNQDVVKLLEAELKAPFVGTLIE